MTMNPFNPWSIRAGTIFLAVLMACVWGAAVSAHQVNQGYVFLKVFDDRVSGEVEFTVEDLNKVLDLGLRADGTLVDADLRPHEAAIRDYIEQHVAIVPEGATAPFRLGAMKLVSIPQAQYAAFHFDIGGLSSSPRYVDMTYTAVFEQDPEHRGFLINFRNWKTGTFDEESNIVLAFSPSATSARFDLSAATVWSGMRAMVDEGIHHIWIGIDHILFLVALLLPASFRREQREWQPVAGFKPAFLHVLAIVTLFTVAHTLTLSAAVLGSVSLSPRIVESIIALSIAIAALDVLLPVFGRRIWFVIFGFGLFHGFGFASVLGDIGIQPKYMVHSLFGFNVGVEIGQVMIVAMIFPLLYWLRNVSFYRRIVMPGGALLLIAIALYWFIERAFEIDLPAGEWLQLVTGGN